MHYLQRQRGGVGWGQGRSIKTLLAPGNYQQSQSRAPLMKCAHVYAHEGDYEFKQSHHYFTSMLCNYKRIRMH